VAKIETIIRKFLVQILSLFRSLSNKGEHLYQTQKWAHQFSLSFETLCSRTRNRIAIINEASQQYAEKIPQLTEALHIPTDNKNQTIKLFQQKIDDLNKQLREQDTPENQSNSFMKEQIIGTKKQLETTTIDMHAAELVFDQEIAKIAIPLQSITEAKRQLDATLIRNQIEVLVLYDSTNHPTGIPIKCHLLPLNPSLLNIEIPHTESIPPITGIDAVKQLFKQKIESIKTQLIKMEPLQIQCKQLAEQKIESLKTQLQVVLHAMRAAEQLFKNKATQLLTS
jgi:hypothetical protein